jgi:hypothetical protein
MAGRRRPRRPATLDRRCPQPCTARRRRERAEGHVGSDERAAGTRREVRAGPTSARPDVEYAPTWSEVELTAELVGLVDGGVAVRAPHRADHRPLDLVVGVAGGDGVALGELAARLALVATRRACRRRRSRGRGRAWLPFSWAWRSWPRLGTRPTPLARCRRPTRRARVRSGRPRPRRRRLRCHRRA